jgi:hypothetical protein
VCHTATTRALSNGTTYTADTAHGTERCTNCHSHEQVPDKAFQGSGDCTLCHNTARGTRRTVVSEFTMTWSHKKSGGGAVTKWDCIVCHMEGNPTDASLSGVHGDGFVNLRDPDTGNNIKTTTWTGTGAGYYTTTDTTDMTFTQFSRNLSTTTIEPAAKAVMINQCLKCHDSNGATAFNTGGTLNPIIAASGTAYSATKPFATTITGAAYTGAGVTAGGTAGAVTDVKASFATTNASYHPILGKNNNSYVNNSQLVAPWNTLAPNKTLGTITSWGFLITCWDCHAPVGASGPQTKTVTAHGAAVTARGNIWSSGVTASTNLCRACHFSTSVTRGHGTGSAASSVASNPGPYMVSQCFYCHFSSMARATRPIAAQDMHGFDTFAPAMGTDTMWPVGTANTYKPYAFMRNVGPNGNWRSVTGWRPRSGPSVPTGGATCGGNVLSNATCSGNTHSAYAPGGVY